MIAVSQAWKDNQSQNLVNESYIRIAFKISDPEAIEDASLSANNEVWFSRVDETIDGEDKNIVPYATLEKNRWLLDGSKKLLPNSTDVSDTSYISNQLSLDSCLYSSNPIITIAFSEVHRVTIPAISLVFDEENGEYARDFKVHIYKNDVKKDTITVTDNTSIKVIVQKDITEYDEIQIEIVKWCLPNRRARVSEIFLGIVKEFDKSNLIDLSHSQEVDPIGATTPKVELNFSIDNSDNTFNPDFEEGLYRFLARKQEIIVKYGYKLGNSIEYIDAGKFYLSEWETPQNGLEASFGARDLLEFMSDTYVYGKYSPDSPVSLYDLAEQVLISANLPTNEDGSKKWSLSDTLKNFTTTAPLPICTQAECLQYIAQAGCCVLFYDRSGTLHIEPISEDLSDYEVNKFNSYSCPEVSLQKILKSINIKVYHYYVGSTDEEVFNGTVNIVGTQKIIISYAKACVTNASKVQITNGTLVSSSFYTNACVLEITANGNVDIVITGDVLEDSQSDFLLTNDDQGEEQEVDNPLITSTTWANTVAQWVKSWLINRKIIDLDFRVDPRLDALSKIKVTGKFTTQNVRVTSTEFKYGGSFTGSAKGRVI